MNEPAPENITGEIVERHTYSHEIQHRIPWGYVTLGVGLMALAWVLYRSWLSGGQTGAEPDEDGLSDEEAVDVPVESVGEGYNQVAGLLTER